MLWMTSAIREEAYSCSWATLGENLFNWLIIPSLLLSDTFVGALIFLMASVLAGSAEIPLALITLPRNTILLWENLHLSLLSVMPAASSFFSTTCKRVLCSFLFLPVTRMSSTWHTTPGDLLSISFMRHGKCSGALAIPKGSLLKQKRP